jgi:hypothetical protein
LLLGKRLCELALQGVDPLLIGRDQSVPGCGHSESADDEQDTETSQQICPAVARS